MRWSAGVGCVLVLVFELASCDPADPADPSSSAQGGAGGEGGSITAAGGTSGKSAGGGVVHSAAGGVTFGGTTEAAVGGASGGSPTQSGGAGVSGNASGGANHSGSSGVTNAPAGSNSGGAVAGGFGGGASGGSPAGGAPLGGAGAGGDRPRNVLLYYYSTLDIPTVPAQLSLLEQKLASWQYEADRSKDPGVFNDASLSAYAAVAMINTCFWPFGENQSGKAQSEALERFVQQGGGLFGTHCADVTFQSANPPALYNQLIGGRASSQNFDGKSDCTKMGDHPTTAGLPASFQYSGNLDDTDFLAPDSMVLVRCTWATGREVAVSWVRSEGAGRVFYTNFGKVDSDFTDPTVGNDHLFSGLAWVLGRPAI
jgi:type 1 glutamine amidotransferase